MLYLNTTRDGATGLVEEVEAHVLVRLLLLLLGGLGGGGSSVATGSSDGGGGGKGLGVGKVLLDLNVSAYIFQEKRVGSECEYYKSASGRGKASPISNLQ